MFTHSIEKFKVAKMLNWSKTTLHRYINVRYYKELHEKHDYEKNQKMLTPNQLNFLQEKIGLTDGKEI